MEAYDHASVSVLNAQAIIVDEGNCYVVAVRGTEIKKIVDIISDAYMIPWLTAYGWVHRGYLKMARRLYKKIKERTNDKPIRYITGHSMGGSVAILLGWMFKSEVIAIAAPMCMRTFRKLPFKLTLIKNCPDPIPRINFWLYKEEGEVIQLGEEAGHICKHKDIKVLQLTSELKYHPIAVYAEAYENSQ